MKKRILNEMLGDGHKALTNCTSNCCRADHQVPVMQNFSVSMPVSKVVMGISSNSYYVGFKSAKMRLDTSSFSQPVASALTDGGNESELAIQDEHELKKERKHELKKERKTLPNKESARRSRIHKQGNYHRLQGLVEELDNEISMLIHNLKWHAKSCVKLMRENKSLSDELKLTCGTDMISTVEAQNSNQVDQSLHGESNSDRSESPCESDSFPDYNTDTSNSDWEIETDSA